jgi:hypothetical protein
VRVAGAVQLSSHIERLLPLQGAVAARLNAGDDSCSIVQTSAEQALRLACKCVRVAHKSHPTDFEWMAPHFVQRFLDVVVGDVWHVAPTDVRVQALLLLSQVVKHDVHGDGTPAHGLAADAVGRLVGAIVTRSLCVTADELQEWEDDPEGCDIKDVRRAGLS